MAAAYFPATIIETNNSRFLGVDLTDYGYDGIIPSVTAGGRPDGDYWAVPITEGVVSGFNYVPVTPSTLTAPTPQSFRVFRLITTNTSDWYYVLGTVANYNEVQADWECCVGSPAVMPTDLTPLAPSQLMCAWNNDTDKDYFAVFAAPNVQVLNNLYAYGYYNGAALAALSGSGYGNTTVLAAAMTSVWGATVGGTFVANGNTITLTQTAGSGDDDIAISIYQMNPSS